MTTIFRHIRSSTQSAAGVGPSAAPVADTTPTNVFPLLAGTLVPQIAALIDEEKDLCAGCGAETWSYFPCESCA